MRLLLRSLLPTLLSLLLFVAPVRGALAASSQLAAHRHSLRMDAVKITITTTGGTVWGTVTARYTFQHRTTRRSCSAGSCTLRIPQGVTVHLGQTPSNTATWPFKDWQVTTHQRTKTMMGSPIAVKVTGSMSVTAVYVLARSQSSSSGNGGSSGSGW